MSSTVRLYGYARALRGGARLMDKSHSEYNARMNYLSASIFGDYKKPVTRENLRLTSALERRPIHDRPEIARYYPAHEETTALMQHLREYGLYRDEHQDYVDEMERMRKLRGKSKLDRNRKK
jgi:small subunit ribosomal protein S33